MPLFVRRLLAGAFLAFVTIGDAKPVEKPVTVNSSLLRFHEQFSQPQLVKVSSRVHAAFAYEYSNFAFIEGPDGVIVVDSGWYPGPVKRALAAYRKLTDKPIRALIFTHPHLDHIGGSTTMLEGAPEGVVVLGHIGWDERAKYDSSTLAETISQRALSQFGMLLRPQDRVGAGIGPTPSMEGSPGVVTPNMKIRERQDIRLAGLDITLIPSAGDIPQNLMVWVEEDEVLFTGDLLGGTFPYMESARFEPDRDPKAMVASLDLALSLRPKAVVAGHGPVFIGRGAVENNLTANRDVIQLADNHVDYSISQGFSADQAMESFVLPVAFKRDPYLQPHYHRIDWMIRGMYAKRVGWNARTDDLSALPELEAQRRLLPLLGGEDAVLSLAANALEEGDSRWALYLLDIVLHPEPTNARARELRVGAMRSLAASTDSANERNYLLTEVASESGQIDWSVIYEQRRAARAPQLTVPELLQRLALRVAPERVQDFGAVVSLDVGSDFSARWALRNGVFAPSFSLAAADIGLRLRRDALEAIYVGRSSWSDLIGSGDVVCESGCERLDDFVRAFGR